MQVWGLVLAAGDAKRFGSRKQFASLGDLRLVDRVVRTVSSACDAVVLVLPSGVGWDGAPVAAAVEGGTTRAKSVRRGLRAVPVDVDIIVVHDAAHPLAGLDLFRSVIGAVVDGADAAIPALTLTEPIKRVRNGQVVETLPRENLVLVQTPHAFRADVLRAVHARGADGIEDSEMVEHVAATISVVPGDPRNIHVATKDDLAIATRLLGAS